MRRARRARIWLAVTGLLLAGAMMLRIDAVDAGWNDAEHLGGSLASASLPTPGITACTTTTVLGVFSSVTVTWSVQEAERLTGMGFRLTLQEGGTQRVVDSPSIADLGVDGSGRHRYSWTASRGLLSSLISNLLGSTTTITVQGLLGNWTSTGDDAQLSIALLGLNPQCTY